ncbi:MAG TPA: c-type cytochrome [Burkholderiaceae bacterium]|nr:c-type cytochrome [Burkholderiaceae bacterium]
MTARSRRMLRVALTVAVLAALAAALVAWLNVRGEAPLDGAAPGASKDAAVIARGEYLARVGNCAGCHTGNGGAAYGGGTGIETPFGVVFASNLTPDPDTGIGRWSAAEFRRAMHNGRSRDGRLLYPAFPYPNYTRVTREDSDAIFAYLMSREPVRQPNAEHRLRWPYNLQASLAVWRALYFRPERFEADPGRTAEWNRGSYLVHGLGHCDACHASRNRLGATVGETELAGGLIPMRNWYAPSLAGAGEAGVAGWGTDEVVALLKTGVSPRGSAMGPMADVVYRSTQFLSDADAGAIAAYLKSLPAAPHASREGTGRRAAGGAEGESGEAIYREQCAGCHGPQGEGVAGMYPPLAGNRAVVLSNPVNVVNAILDGGFPPTTAGNPRPFGMPPFRQTLRDGDIASLATFIRQSWGNNAAPVTAGDVARAR